MYKGAILIIHSGRGEEGKGGGVDTESQRLNLHFQTLFSVLFKEKKLWGEKC